MSKRTKRWAVCTVLVIVIMGMLSLTAFAGSPAKPFSFTYNTTHTVLTSTGTKTDAGTPSGNYASVDDQSHSSGLQVTFAVTTTSGVAVTGSRTVTGATYFDLYYTTAVTNGSLVLRGLCAGTGTCSGVWYP